MSDVLLVTCTNCSNKFPLDDGFCNVCLERNSLQPGQLKIELNETMDLSPVTNFKVVPNASSKVKGKKSGFFLFSAPLTIFGVSLALVLAFFLFKSWSDSQPTESYKKGWDAGNWVKNEDPFQLLPGLDVRESKIDICLRNYEIDKTLVKSKSEYMLGCKDALGLSN